MSWLDEPVVTGAICWRLVRRDGVGVGLTAHDRDLTIGGNRYRANPGMTPSAVRRGSPLDADTMDVAGALSAGAITADDLAAGRWDGAAAELFAVDWREPGGACVPLGGGTLGAIETGEGGFTAELRGAGAALDRPVGEETQAECRATLGDGRCGVALAGRRRIARVVAAEGAAVTFDAALEAGAWGGGRLVWLDGANAGLAAAIVVDAGARVTLAAVPVGAVAAGDRAELTEGCDRGIATCAARFDNAANFRGEPYLPGADLLTRYPGA